MHNIDSSDNFCYQIDDFSLSCNNVNICKVLQTPSEQYNKMQKVILRQVAAM